MSDKVPMTAGGLVRLEDELKHLKSAARPEAIRAIAQAREHGDLKSAARPEAIRAIAQAREHGDLSENAEYHAARERQSFIEGRVLELEDKIARSVVIDISSLSGNSVKFGATVSVVDEDTDEELTYQLVGEMEADVKNGRLAITSPLARELIGKEVGDSVEVTTPKGEKVYEIVKIKFV